MTKGEFKEFHERIGWGEEFSFYYKNKKYWISQNLNGCYLTKVKDLLLKLSIQQNSCSKKNGKIEGKLLTEIYEDIDW